MAADTDELREFSKDLTFHGINVFKAGRISGRLIERIAILADELDASRQRRCGDCKFWGNDDWPKLIGDDGTQRICTRVADQDGLGHESSEGLIAVTFSSKGTGSGIATKADFGCVLFEAKTGG